MKKSDLRLLEKVFAAEIDPQLGHLPFQSKSKKYEKLEEDGYVEKATVVLGGRFPVKVTGWFLTHLGRMTYCETCKDEPEPQTSTGD